MITVILDTVYTHTDTQMPECAAMRLFRALAVKHLFSVEEQLLSTPPAPLWFVFGKQRPVKGK